MTEDKNKTKHTLIKNKQKQQQQQNKQTNKQTATTTKQHQQQQKINKQTQRETFITSGLLLYKEVLGCICGLYGQFHGALWSISKDTIQVAFCHIILSSSAVIPTFYSRSMLEPCVESADRYFHFTSTVFETGVNFCIFSVSIFIFFFLFGADYSQEIQI